MSNKKFREALNSPNFVIGANATLKNINSGKTKVVFLASNCKREIKEDIKYYCKISSIEIVELDIDNKELGTLCKKPFFVSVASV